MAPIRAAVTVESSHRRFDLRDSSQPYKCANMTQHISILIRIFNEESSLPDEYLDPLQEPPNMGSRADTGET